MTPGILNLYKPKGYTSHDAVAILRKRLPRGTKVGHTGTLDPQAEGVLPLCVGRATKIAGHLTGQDKSYRAQLCLGFTTDTDDHTGEVLSQAPVTCPPAEIAQAAQSFVGTYEQLPPMYSAIKIEGKRLYQLAREGKPVERKPRTVRIDRIVLLEQEAETGRLWLDIDCGKGTYIRSLCADIGQKLGCGGCMGDLIRTRSGPFRVEDTLHLEDLDEGGWQERLIPVKAALPLPGVQLQGSFKQAVNGGAVPYQGPEIAPGGQCWLYAEDTLIGLYVRRGDSLKPEVMFYGAEPAGN